MLSKAQIASFQHDIFCWWAKNKRDLPWRRTHDPYAILVSEVMLQQTQVSRVLPKYKEFLFLFPDIFVLANASVSQILRAWKGMGYNRRALYLKQLAEKIVQQYHGIFPKQEKELINLPGLGKYTARAILVFAFKQDVVLVDTNIRQILVHHFFSGIAQKESVLEEVANQLLPTGRSWEWHQALMDYGALQLPKSRNRNVLRNERFEDSNRFFRGRVIDYLREKSWNENILAKEMMKVYGKDEEFHRKIILGLSKEGLLEREENGIIRLPE
jgi:A/G-specific adenine glycosylase